MGVAIASRCSLMLSAQGELACNDVMLFAIVWSQVRKKLGQELKNWSVGPCNARHVKHVEVKVQYSQHVHQ